MVFLQHFQSIESPPCSLKHTFGPFFGSFHIQVTNDIFTKEDGEFLIKHGALPEERIRAVETGGCPHAAIREDISINLGPLEELSNLYKADLLLCESGGGIFLLDPNYAYIVCKPVYLSYWYHVACLFLVKCYHVNLPSCLKVNTGNASF